jgi:hypothetical protein
MSTNQPTWKYVANLGDVSPLEYGGYFVRVDTTGVYAPEAEYLYAPDSDDADAWMLYTVALERCTFADGVLSDNKYHPELSAWFADDLDAIARCMDWDIEELRAALCSDDPLQLAQGYRAIGEYHGFENFDSYPQTFAKRWRVERFARKYRPEWSTV